MLLTHACITNELQNGFHLPLSFCGPDSFVPSLANLTDLIGSILFYAMSEAAQRINYVQVKVRSRIQDSASYNECTVHISNLQLRLTKRSGGPSEIIVLGSDRVVSMLNKGSRFYVMIECGPKVVKLKLPTAEAQRYWFDTFNVSLVATPRTPHYPKPDSAAACGPLSTQALNIERKTFDFSDDALEKLTLDFQYSFASNSPLSSIPSTPALTPSLPAPMLSPPPVPPRSDFSLKMPPRSKTEKKKKPGPISLSPLAPTRTAQPSFMSLPVSPASSLLGSTFDFTSSETAITMNEGSITSSL